MGPPYAYQQYCHANADATRLCRRRAEFGIRMRTARSCLRAPPSQVWEYLVVICGEDAVHVAIKKLGRRILTLLLWSNLSMERAHFFELQCLGWSLMSCWSAELIQLFHDASFMIFSRSVLHSWPCEPFSLWTIDPVTFYGLWSSTS